MASGQAPSPQQDRSAIAEELERRIRADIRHHGGAMPERAALAWGGYIAAMLEWDLISVGAHERLNDLLPRGEPTEEDPVAAIFLGRAEAAEPDQ